jgi:hypothetical protein
VAVHEVVEPSTVAPESNRNDDEDWMDDIIANIGREYDTSSRE